MPYIPKYKPTRYTRVTDAQMREAYKYVRLRDGMRCQICGAYYGTVTYDIARVYLDVNHLKGRGANIINTPTMISLCSIYTPNKCHNLVYHANTRKWKTILLVKAAENERSFSARSEQKRGGV